MKNDDKTPYFSKMNNLKIEDSINSSIGIEES
jgi:hypothetical protein